MSVGFSSTEVLGVVEFKTRLLEVMLLFRTAAGWISTMQASVVDINSHVDDVMVGAVGEGYNHVGWQTVAKAAGVA